MQEQVASIYALEWPRPRWCVAPLRFISKFHRDHRGINHVLTTALGASHEPTTHVFHAPNQDSRRARERKSRQATPLTKRTMPTRSQKAAEINTSWDSITYHAASLVNRKSAKLHQHCVGSTEMLHTRPGFSTSILHVLVAYLFMKSTQQHLASDNYKQRRADLIKNNNYKRIQPMTHCRDHRVASTGS